MTVSRQAPRVLVVDDEESIRAFASQALNRAGYQTIVASDGPEALRLAREHAPIDLLLVDLVMPGMRGDELAKLIRQQEPALKVIYLTGFRSQLFKYRPALWENEALIEKPASVQTLLDRVSTSLFGHTRGPRGE